MTCVIDDMIASGIGFVFLPRPLSSRVAERITHRGGGKLLAGRIIALGPPQGTIESATPIQTPSQAEHGLGGVLVLCPRKGNSQ